MGILLAGTVCATFQGAAGVTGIPYGGFQAGSTVAADGPMSAEGTVVRVAALSDVGWGPSGATPASVDGRWEILPGMVGLATSWVQDVHVFYNESLWDGWDAGANDVDDAAIAPDKTALRTGGQATFANYTSYVRGLNGIMADVVDLAAIPEIQDAVWRTGTTDAVAGWLPAPSPGILQVRWGAGINGSDRITWIWGADAVRGAWLEGVLRPTANTGLSGAERFYWGNAVGETGDRSTDAVVDAQDEANARANPRNVLRPAEITDVHDFNRDGRVDPADQLIARAWATTPETALRLIVPQLPSGSAGIHHGLSGQTRARWLRAWSRHLEMHPPRLAWVRDAGAWVLEWEALLPVNGDGNVGMPGVSDDREAAWEQPPAWDWQMATELEPGAWRPVRGWGLTAAVWESDRGVRFIRQRGRLSVTGGAESKVEARFFRYRLLPATSGSPLLSSTGKEETNP